MHVIRILASWHSTSWHSIGMAGRYLPGGFGPYSEMKIVHRPELRKVRNLNLHMTQCSITPVGPHIDRFYSPPHNIPQRAWGCQLPQAQPPTFSTCRQASGCRHLACCSVQTILAEICGISSSTFQLSAGCAAASITGVLVFKWYGRYSNYIIYFRSFAMTLYLCSIGRWYRTKAWAITRPWLLEKGRYYLWNEGPRELNHRAGVNWRSDLLRRCSLVTSDLRPHCRFHS